VTSAVPSSFVATLAAAALLAFSATISLAQIGVGQNPSAQVAGDPLPGDGPAQARVRVGLSVSDNSVFAPVAAAAELGFYAEAGLSVRIVPLRGVAAAEEALAAGHVDVIDHTVAYAARAIAAGSQLKIVAVATNGFYGWSLIVRTDSPTKSLRDLVGAKIGVGPRLSVADMAARRLADLSSASFQFTPTGPGALAPALRTGELDAVLYSATVAQREVTSGNARTILDLTDPADRTALYGYSASRRMREARGDDLRAFLGAVHRAAAHMKNDKAWSLRFLRTFTSVNDPALAEILFERVVRYLSTDGASQPEDVARGLALAARAWNAPVLADLDPAMIVTNVFASPDP